MDNKNEYRRSVGGASSFPTYDDVSKSEDYSSTSSYENTSTSDLGNLGSLETTSFNYGSIPQGSFWGSYTANYQEPESDSDSGVQGGFTTTYSGSYVANYQEPEPETISSSFSSEKKDAENEGNAIRNGMDSSAYQSLYSEYDSSQAGNYQSSVYSASVDTHSTLVEDSASADTHSALEGGSGFDALKDDYSSLNGGFSFSELKDDYSALKSDTSALGGFGYSEPKDDYSIPKSDTSALGGFGYSEPKDDYSTPKSDTSASSGFGFGTQKDDYSLSSGDLGYKEPRDDYNSYATYDSTPQTPITQSSYQTAPLDKKGRPLKNRFGLKLIISIVEICFATLWGILGLIFTCMANNAYNRGDWEVYQSKSKTASIMLWIGLVFTLISIAAVVFIVSAGVYTFRGVGQNNNPYVYEQPIEAGGDDGYVDGGNTGGDDGSITSSAGVLAGIAAEEYNSLEINGKKLDIPGNASDFIKVLQDCGYTFEYDVNKTHVKPHSEEYLHFYNGDGYMIGTMEIYNTNQEEEIFMVDGVIGSIKLYFEEENLPISYLGGLSNASTAKDFVNKLGEPSSTSSFESFEEYQWDTDEGWIEVDYSDGKIYAFSIFAYRNIE